MPSNPPNGTYTSTITGTLSSWSGSFTYNNGAIEYTRTSPSATYPADNTDNGNAIVFSISVGNGDTIKFEGRTYKSGPGGAEYSGNVEKHGPAGAPDGWTATHN